VAAEKNQEKEQASEDKQKQILDLAEAWKKMYFDTEATLAKAVDEYVAGDSFTAFLEKMGTEYLSMYKTQNQNVERFFANSPIPSKKDIARVAELVLNVEEKVDNLDLGISAGFSRLAENMSTLVDFQAVLRDELITLRQEVQLLQQQLQEASRPLSSGTEKPTARTRSQTGASNNPTESTSDATAQKDSKTGAGTATRPPRSRKKNPQA